MFRCKHCKTLQDALSYERARTKELMNRLMALTKPESLSAVQFAGQPTNSSEYYGGPDDEFVTYNEFGEQVLKKNERPLRQ